jgi:transcriptional regulator with XRE-family HTH domain
VNERDWSQSTLAERIAFMCEETGLSQNKLGAPAGIAGGVMSRLANKQKHSAGRPETLRKLADAHAYRFEWLADGRGQPRGETITAALDRDSTRSRDLAIEIISDAGKAETMEWAIAKAREQEHRGATVQDWLDIIEELHKVREKAFERLENVAKSPERKREKDIFDAEPAAKRTKRRSSGTMSAERGPGARGAAPLLREEERPRTYTRERR